VAARTGTGKTLAFLVPAVELVRACTSDQPTADGTIISTLVISPTRELGTCVPPIRIISSPSPSSPSMCVPAMQIAKEAWVLSGGPGGDVKVGSVMGGRDFFAEQQELQEAPAVHLLVRFPMLECMW